jgi:uncharacterized protein YaiI (UPF0178 family)
MKKIPFNTAFLLVGKNVKVFDESGNQITHWNMFFHAKSYHIKEESKDSIKDTKEVTLCNT